MQMKLCCLIKPTHMCFNCKERHCYDCALKLLNDYGYASNWHTGTSRKECGTGIILKYCNLVYIT